ncbi:MAG: YIP1 family protein [candidate division WOR-3 bacterium]|nr:YIP1 family protein [candidate division WOR-3 bacterium]
MSTLRPKIIGIFSRPTETFGSIDEKPDWLFPFLILIVVSILSLVITYHKVLLPEQIAKVTEMGNLTEEQLAKAREMMGGMRGILLSLVGIIITVPLFLFLKSGIFLVFSNILGGESTFRKVLSVSSWALLIEVTEIIVKTPIMFLKLSSQVITSLALFFPFLSYKSLTFKILNKFDFFTIWELALIGIGLSIVSKFSIKKGECIVFSLWIIWIIISVTGSKFMPGL